MKQYYIVDAFTGQPFGGNPAEGTSYTKNKHTPTTLMMAPRTSRMVTFWWNKSAAGAMMRMGVSAKSVWAMPADVYCVANSDALTPMKGPNIVDASTHHMALRSLTA